jgi:hypothetical protein
MKGNIWENYVKERSKKNPISFTEIFTKLKYSSIGDTHSIKVQSVFLTLLHLSNEKNLTILEENGDLFVYPNA